MKTAQTLAGHHSASFTVYQYADAVPQQLEDAGEKVASVLLDASGSILVAASKKDRLWFRCKRLIQKVRPKGFEPLTPWFEELYSKQSKYLENKEFWQFCCATEPPLTRSYALEIVDTWTFQ